MLTEKRVLKLAVPSKGNVLHFDGGIPGFALRVTAGDIRSFVLNYRVKGHARRYTIARAGLGGMTVADARKKALALLSEIQEGRDPLAERVSDRERPTVSDLCHDYFEFYAEQSKRPSSVANDRLMVKNAIVPHFGSKAVSDVSHRDVAALHAKLRAHPISANRVMSLLSKMFSLAMTWNMDNPVWRADNPARGVVRYPENKRTRWLEAEELSRLKVALDAYPDQVAADVFRLLLYTGARKHEVLSAVWWQIDLKRAVWTKPAATTKQKKISRVPLSAAAVALLADIKERNHASEQDYVFPGKPGSHLQPGTHLRRGSLAFHWRAVCAAARLEGVHTHDLRHTYASTLISSGVPIFVVSRLLGHSSVQTTERYSHLSEASESPLREATERMGRLMAS